MSLFRSGYFWVGVMLTTILGGLALLSLFWPYLASVQF